MTRPIIAPSDAIAINAVLVAARQAADVVCDRWSIALTLAAFQGENRFGGFMQRTGIASRLATARLQALEASGILVRVPYSVRPLRHEYLLTNMGQGLQDFILQLARWEQNWSSPSRPRLTHLACGAQLRPELRCRACQKVATARAIDLKVSRTQLQHMPKKQTAHRRSIVSSEHASAVPNLLGPSLDIMGDKWGIEVLLCAFFRIHRFNDFRLCTGIAANILSDRLDRFVRTGLLSGSHQRESGNAGYYLTEKGIDVYGALVALQDWADKWLTERYRSPVSLIHRDCGEIFRPLTTCTRCHRPVAKGEVRF